MNLVLAVLIGYAVGIIIGFRIGQRHPRMRVWKFGAPLIPPTRPSERTLAELDRLASESHRVRWQAEHAGANICDMREPL